MPFIFVMRTFKIHICNNFQLYNIKLLTKVIILYTRSSELIHFITVSLHYLIDISTTPSPQAQESNIWSSVSINLAFLASTFKIYYLIFIFLWLFHLAVSSSSIHVFTSVETYFFSWLNNKYSIIFIFYIHTSIDDTLFLYLGFCE